MNIYQKLLEIRKSVNFLSKDKRSYEYAYVSSSQVLGSVREKMNELGVLLEPRIIGAKFSDILRGTNSKNKETVNILTEIDFSFTWVNVDNPDEKVTCNWYGQGWDTSGEKGVGKACTYAEKYFILKYFNIPTDKDDPDGSQNPPDKQNTKNLENNNTQNKVYADDTDIISGIESLHTDKEINKYFNKYLSASYDKQAFVEAINKRKEFLKGVNKCQT